MKVLLKIACLFVIVIFAPIGFVVAVVCAGLSMGFQFGMAFMNEPKPSNDKSTPTL